MNSAFGLPMLKLTQVFTVNSVLTTHIANGKYKIELEDDYRQKSFMSMNDEEVEFFTIRFIELVGKKVKIMFHIEPYKANMDNSSTIVEIQGLDSTTDLILNELSALDKTTFYTNSFPNIFKNQSYKARFSTYDELGGSLSSIPCPDYEFFISLTKTEFEQLSSIDTLLIAKILKITPFED